MTCTTKQIGLLLKYACTNTQVVTASKAGMSTGAAKRYVETGGKRKKKKPEERSWRTRTDPFADVWAEVRLMLERDKGLEAKTLMDWLSPRLETKTIIHPWAFIALKDRQG